MPNIPPPGPNDISDRQLRFGLWLNAHRSMLRRIGYGFLIAVSAASWGFTLWGVVNHFFIEGAALRRDLAELAQRANPRAAIVARQRPTPLEVSDVILLPTGGGRYDAASRVVNRNPRWVAELEYVLEVPGSPQEVARATVLPNRERWLLRLGAASAESPTAAVLTIRSTSWRRVTHVEAADVERFVRERLNVEVRDAAFLGPTDLALGTAPAAGTAAGVARLSRATFTVANQSAYGYRIIECAVLLRRGTAIVGIDRVTIADLRAGEERPAAATWTHALGAVTGIEVQPYVDVFDAAAFLPPPF